MNKVRLFARVAITGMKLMWNVCTISIGYMIGARTGGWGDLCSVKNEDCLNRVDNVVPIALSSSFNMMGRFSLNVLGECNPQDPNADIFRHAKLSYALSILSIILTSLIAEQIDFSNGCSDPYVRANQQFYKGVIVGVILTVLDETGANLVKYTNLFNLQPNQGNHYSPRIQFNQNQVRPLLTNQSESVVRNSLG